MEIFNEETIVRWFSSKTDCDIQLSNLILNSNFEKKCQNIQIFVTHYLNVMIYMKITR